MKCNGLDENMSLQSKAVKTWRKKAKQNLLHVLLIKYFLARNVANVTMLALNTIKHNILKTFDN